MQADTRWREKGCGVVMEAVVERIKKLLSLAKNNTSVHEAATAAALAQKLLQENKLQLADVEATRDELGEKVEMSTFLEEGVRVITWRSQLTTSVR